MSFLRKLIAGSVASLLGLVSLSIAQQPAALTIVKTLEGHKELVYTVNFSPDGKHLLTGSFDKTLKLWDVAAGKEVKTFAGTSGHNDLILTSAFSPDGRGFASGAKDNSIKLWDMPISGAFRDYPGATAPVLTQAITPDGSKLAAGQQDGLIRVWTTSDGKQVAELKGSSAITSMLVSPNGQWLAAGDAAGKVTLYNLADGKQLGQAAAHSKDVKGLGFHPNHQLLFTAGGDGLIKVWNLPLSGTSVSYNVEKTTITQVYRAPDGRQALACADKTIRVLKADGTLEKSLPAASAAINHLSLAGDTVIASLADGRVAWWDVKTGTFTHQVELGKVTQDVKIPATKVDGIEIASSKIKLDSGKAINHISLRSDGQAFAIAMEDGSVMFGEVSKDKSKKADKVITGKAQVVPSSTGKPIVGVGTGSRLGRTKRWRINFKYEDDKEFVNKLANLKVVVGVRMKEGKFLIYETLEGKAPFSPMTMETGDFQKYAQKMQRLWVVNNNKEVCESFAKGAELKEPPVSIFIFIPQEMEEALLRKETEHHKLNEEEIRNRKIFTKFDVTRQDKTWNIKVEDQGVDQNLRYETPSVTLETSIKLAVQFHPTDANLLAVADNKKKLHLWLVKENKADKTISLEDNGSLVHWSKDGSRLAVVCGLQLTLINPKDGAILRKFKQVSPIVACSFSGDGNQLALVTQDGVTRVLESTSGKELSVQSGDAVSSSWSGDGKTLLLVNRSQVKQGGTKSPARTITAGSGPLLGIAILDGGNRAVVATTEGIAKVYNLTNGNLDKELKGHAGPIEAVASTANSQVIFTAGADKTLRAFNATDGKELKNMPAPAGAKTLVVQGNNLVVGHADGSITVINITLTPAQAPAPDFGKVLHSFKQAGPVTSVVMPSTVSTIYSASSDKMVKAWKLAGDIPLRNLAGHGNLVDAVAYSPDGLTLASSSHDGTIRFWNPSDGKQTGEVKLNPQPLYCAAWRSDGKQLAIGCFDRTIKLIDVAGKKVEREIKGFDDKSAPQGHGDAVYTVAYTSSNQLYSAGADGKIKLWNTADGGLVKEFIDPALKDKAQRDFINTIKLTNDGKKLVAAGNGGWITIWSTADGKLLHSQKMPMGLYGLSVNPDGSLIATGNMNGTVYVIKMP